jgi:CRISPR-associated endonuclease/helicase Cas3
MCAQHRSDTLLRIKEVLGARYRALSEGNCPDPVHVISTQLVEAGVDVDFPTVYRAMAGLDSIVQAAGRCNREGRLDQGHVYVFEPPQPSPPGLLRRMEQVTRVMLSALPPDTNLLDVSRFDEYFRKLYADTDLDPKNIRDLSRCDKTAQIPFRDIAQKLRLIDEENGGIVFVRYRKNEGDKTIDTLLGKLRKDGPDRWLMRKLQRYGVTLYQHDIDRFVKRGDIDPLPGDCAGLYAQSEENDIFYDPILGVIVDGAPGDPATLTF